MNTYTYDSAIRLIQVSDQSLVVSMDYNGLGQRLSMDAASENAGTGGSGGGIYLSSGATLAANNSAIVNNSATDAVAGGAGGGIYFTGNSTITLTNVTISGNSTNRHGAGIRGYTGGASSLTNVTISGNTVTNSAFSGNGGGVYFSSGGTVNIKNSIIAGNTDLSGTTIANDCYGSGIVSLGHNLVGDNSACAISPATGDLFGTSASPINAMLGALQDNGGNTLTQALQAGSPAINAGDNNGCPATDQRGYNRNATCDMGAYEFNGTATIPNLAAAPQMGSFIPVAFRFASKNAAALVQNAPAPLQQTNTYTSQPNAADGVDTYLLSTSPTTNNGTDAALGVGESNNATNRFTRSLIKFNLSSIPANAVITSATLSLWTTTDLSDNNRTIRVFRLKRAFNESQATWNIASTGVNWQTAGASGANDRESADIGSIQILASEPLNTEKQISLTPAQIQEMTSLAFTNNGFIIVADTELNDRFNYKSSDASNASQRPKLVIQYTIPSATNTPTASQTPTATPSSTPTQPATVTPSPTASATQTPSATPSPTFTASNTPIHTATPSRTPTPSQTAPATHTPTQTATSAPLLNLALGKPATQSSTFAHACIPIASKAVDGNTDGNFSNCSVTHTNNDLHAWWEVNLGSPGYISSINVWNRTDCCGERLSNYYLFVSDVPFTSADLDATLNQSGVSNFYQAGQAGTPTTVAINRTGRYIRVQLAGSNWLALAEVQVWGPAPTATPTATSTPSKTPTPTRTTTPTRTPIFTATPFISPTPVAGLSQTIIQYDYDPLYRLTEANYSTGDYYHYTYDAVGNRKTQNTMLSGLPLTSTYLYDDANRLSSVNSVSYTWDNNGNLLNDGVNTYVYDSANRLKTITGTSSANFTYNGLGDRLVQNGIHYTLDLNAGLTQVLDDGTNTYLYSVGRVAQINGSNTDYFLGDALGSVRQLTNTSGNIILAKSYQPYGETLASAGSGQSIYGYTSEQIDPSGLVYLRARYYNPSVGRFTSRDTWGGDVNSPLSLNRWMYVEGNPINSTDPSGHSGIGPWCWNNFPSRADAAEKYVDRSAFGDYLNTYTAAGIGVQCWGTNYVYKDFDNSGYGIAQITNNAAYTEWGEPIYEYDFWGQQVYKKDDKGNVIYKNGKPVPVIRGYGLRLRCPDGELEKVLNQNDNKNAVVLMKREIQLVIDVCVGRGCTPTDIYIAAALAQNGPGFNLQNIKDLTSPKALVKNGDVIINWTAYFKNDNNADDTRDQLILFDGVIQELRKRKWYLPDIKWYVVEELKRIGD